LKRKELYTTINLSRIYINTIPNPIRIVHLRCIKLRYEIKVSYTNEKYNTYRRLHHHFLYMLRPFHNTVLSLDNTHHKRIHHFQYMLHLFHNIFSRSPLGMYQYQQKLGLIKKLNWTSVFFYWSRSCRGVSYCTTITKSL